MTLDNIDTILVHPSEEERIRNAFIKHGLSAYTKIITPCDYIKQGKMILFDRNANVYLDIKTKGDTHD